MVIFVLVFFIFVYSHIIIIQMWGVFPKWYISREEKKNGFIHWRFLNGSINEGQFCRPTSSAYTVVKSKKKNLRIPDLTFFCFRLPYSYLKFIPSFIVQNILLESICNLFILGTFKCPWTTNVLFYPRDIDRLVLLYIYPECLIILFSTGCIAKVRINNWLPAVWRIINLLAIVRKI